MINLSSEALLALVTIALSPIFILAIRRLFFHPLSNVPGPKLAALTWYYLAYYDLVLDGASLEHLEVLHRQYGPVIRIGPEKLHFNDPRAYNEIYSTNSKFTKDPRFYASLPPTIFSTVDPRAAKLKRDAVRPLFSRRAIMKLEGVVQECVDRFINVLLSQSSDESSQPVDLFYGYLSITFEIITSYSFSQPFNAISFPNFQHPLLIAFQNSSTIGVLLQYFPFLHVLLSMPRWLSQRTSTQSSALQDLLKTLEVQIDQILADPTALERAEHENIYHHLLNPSALKAGGSVPSRQELVDEAVLLVAAGTDTAANACAVGTFHVLRDRVILRTLMDELVRAWPDVDTPCVGFEKLEKLPYLTAIVKESLRLSHGVTLPLPRVAPTYTKITGITVPSGTVVAMGQTFIHYNADIFPDPRKFLPERWLQPDSRELDNHLVAFSKGPRNCLGMNLAWCELYLIFANVFRKVDMEIFETTQEDMNIKSFFTPKFKGKPLRVYAKPRFP